MAPGMENTRNGGWLWQRLRRPYVVPLLVSLAVAIPQLPHLEFFADDWLLLAAQVGHEMSDATAGDLFRFYGGDPEQIRRQMDRGPLPWFAHPRRKFGSWRPLSSAWFALLHTLFGMRPVGYAIFGLVAYLGLVAAVCRLLWRSLPAAAGWLAGVLFAVASTTFRRSVGSRPTTCC